MTGCSNQRLIIRRQQQHGPNDVATPLLAKMNNNFRSGAAWRGAAFTENPPSSGEHANAN